MTPLDPLEPIHPPAADVTSADPTSAKSPPVRSGPLIGGTRFTARCREADSTGLCNTHVLSETGG